MRGIELILLSLGITGELFGMLIELVGSITHRVSFFPHNLFLIFVRNPLVEEF